MKSIMVKGPPFVYDLTHVGGGDSLPALPQQPPTPPTHTPTPNWNLIGYYEETRGRKRKKMNLCIVWFGIGKPIWCLFLSKLLLGFLEVAWFFRHHNYQGLPNYNVSLAVWGSNNNLHVFPRFGYLLVMLFNSYSSVLWVFVWNIPCSIWYNILPNVKVSNFH